MVVIQWFPPSRKINTVFYDIGCFKCRGDVCDDPCGRKPTYKPSNVDFTWTNVTVENLEANTQYMFVVYSKNNNSVLINGSKWLSVRKRVETEGIFVLIFVSSCSSYALRWLRLILGRYRCKTCTNLINRFQFCYFSVTHLTPSCGPLFCLYYVVTQCVHLDNDKMGSNWICMWKVVKSRKSVKAH